jgi:hypothetical protein
MVIAGVTVFLVAALLLVAAGLNFNKNTFKKNNLGSHFLFSSSC